MAKDLPELNVGVVGHIDHGKSTTVGRLMFDSGNLSDQQLRKFKEMAEAQGQLLLADKEWKRVKKLGRKVVSARRFLTAKIEYEKSYASAKAYGMTQKEIRKNIPYSEAKVSLWITELESDGKIKKIKKGRGNVIALK